MKLEDSDAFVEEMEKNDRRKKNVLIIIITCGILVAILFSLIMYLKIEDAKKFKVYIDGKKIENYSAFLVNFDQVKSEVELEKSKDNKNLNYLVNIEQLAKILGYSYQNGEYKSYTEDTSSCYIRTPYEIVSMKSGANSFTKYILNNSNSKTSENESTESQSGQNAVNIVVKSKNETQKIFYIDEPVQYINNRLYVPISEIADIFNVQLNVSENNRIKIYSLNYMINNYATRIAANYRYSTVSNTYENFTAMADGMLVVGDGTNFGVISISTGKEIISLKYEDIVYMQNTKEFQVSAEGSVGVVSSEGKTIIKPTEYDNITVLDELKKLYLVERNGQYGVINNSGDDIIFCEYDSIGITNPQIYSDTDVRNYNLLFETCIPVEVNGKYGLMDLEGNEILKITYDGLGTANVEEPENSDSSETTSKSSSSKNQDLGILTIPESVGIQGIIVQSDGLYGIFDANVKHLITPCVFTKIYSKTKSGVTTYYLEYDEMELNLSEYLEENELKSISQDEEQEEVEDEETEEYSEEVNTEEEDEQQENEE